MGVINPDGTDSWVETKKPWWNIMLDGHKEVVKKIEGVWMVRFGSEHELVIRDCKKWMKKAGYTVRSYNTPGQPHRRTLWTDRMRTGTYGSGGIKMVSDLIEKGEWV